MPTDGCGNNIEIKYQRTKRHEMLPNRSLNFFYANVRHILEETERMKLRVILKLISHDVDVIVLTETLFSSYEQARKVELDGYKHFFNISEFSLRGGVSIYVKTYLEPLVTVSKFHGGVNFLWVRLNTKGIVIGGFCYAEDEIDTTQFLEEYSNQLKKMQQAIVFGNFNVDLLELESNNEAINYKKMLDKAGFTLLNKIHSKYSTGKTKENSTIMDHISTNLRGFKYKFHLAVIRCNYLCEQNQLYLGVTKMPQNEDDDPPRNKKPRTHSDGDTKQAYEDDSDTESYITESSEASETEDINHDKTNDAADVTSDASEANEAGETNHDRTTSDAGDVTRGSSETEEFDNTTRNSANGRSKTCVCLKRKLPGKEFTCDFCEKIFNCLYIYSGHLNDTHNITSDDSSLLGILCGRVACNSKHAIDSLERPRKRNSSSKDTSRPTRVFPNADDEAKDGDDSDELESSTSEGSSSDDDERGNNDDDNSSSNEGNNNCNEEAKRNFTVGLTKLFLSLQSEKFLQKKERKNGRKRNKNV